MVLQESFIPDGQPSPSRERWRDELGADGVRAAVRAGQARRRGPTCRATATAAARWGWRSSAGSRPSCAVASRSVTVAGDPTPERGGLHVELDVDGDAVDLIGVHLTSRLPYGPPIQLTRLRRQLPAPGTPAIVAGDCNFWGPGVQTFLPGLATDGARTHVAGPAARTARSTTSW